MIGRFEELTRSTSDVQDALISILSEKYISIPELDGDNIVFAKPGLLHHRHRQQPRPRASTTCPRRSSGASTSCTSRS